MEPGNIEGMVRRRQAAIARQEVLARDIGAAGRERIGKVFSSDHMVEQTMRVYREVVRDKLDSRLTKSRASKTA